MPKTKKFSKKNRAAKNTWSLTGPSTSSSVIATFPERMRVRLGYTTSGVFSGATSGTYAWNPNGMFDPDQTGVGHQPLGYDQWTAMYGRYLVHKARFKVELVNVTTNVATVVGVTSINGQNTALSPTQMTQAVEGMRCQWGVLGMSGSPPISFQGVVPLPALVGATSERYIADDRYQALVSANPSEIVGLHLFAHDVAFATNVSVGYNMRIEYEAEFFDRIFPGQSLVTSGDHTGVEQHKDVPVVVTVPNKSSSSSGTSTLWPVGRK